MRRYGKGGSFFLCLLFNILLNLEWSIPAWVLLVLHFVIDLSIVWFFVALAAWVLIVSFWMAVVGWASSCGNIPDPPKENKNPYSVKGDGGQT